jgi:integrase
MSVPSGSELVRPFVPARDFGLSKQLFFRDDSRLHLWTPKKLPAVLSHEEVTQLIEAAPKLLYRTMPMILYGTGLRRAEVVLLKIECAAIARNKLTSCGQFARSNLRNLQLHNVVFPGSHRTEA